MLDIMNNRRVVYGHEKIKETPEILKMYNCKKVFIVTYDNIQPLLSDVVQDLEANNIDCYIYNRITGEPDLFVINEGKKAFVEENCDCTLAYGGGSVIDAAKAIGMLAMNDGLIEEYQMGEKQVTQPCPFFIAIPTTSGTGAEATKVSVVYNNYNNLKKSVYHPTMIADVAILDPKVTADLPRVYTASTGMDALSHAIESYVSLNANHFSEIYSLKALELLSRSLEKASNEGQDLQARGEVALGSYFAGCALVAGIGIAHIVAQPLGAMFKISHGDACSIFLPLAMELNLQHSPEKYRKIAEVLGVDTRGMEDLEAGRAGIEKIKEIRENIGAPDKLTPYVKDKNVDMKDILDNIRQSTGHITCNPRLVNEDLLVEIIEKAM